MSGGNEAKAAHYINILENSNLINYNIYNCFVFFMAKCNARCTFHQLIRMNDPRSLKALAFACIEIVSDGLKFSLSSVVYCSQSRALNA